MRSNIIKFENIIPIANFGVFGQTLFNLAKNWSAAPLYAAGDA